MALKQKWLQILKYVQNESCSQSIAFFREKKNFEKFSNFRPRNRLSFEVIFFAEKTEILVILVKIAKIDQKSDLEWKYDDMFKIKVVQN